MRTAALKTHDALQKGEGIRCWYEHIAQIVDNLLFFILP